MEVTKCSVCGGPIRPDNKRGICRRTQACKKASSHAYVEDNKDRITSRQAIWYQENSERLLAQQTTYRNANADKVRNGKRQWGYRMSPEQYQAMFDAQEGKCRGCKRSDVPLHIDHDHDCCPEIPTCGNCNRGLLCDRCNRGIGFVYENPDTLRALANYLESWEKDRIRA